MTDSGVADLEFAYLGSMQPNAPPCAWCKRRPQAAICLAGDVVFTGRCEPCQEALATAATRHREEREQRERRDSEMAKREREGLPVVGGAAVTRFKRGAGDS